MPRLAEISVDDLTRLVDADRLRDLTFELVSVPSPTGDTVEVAHLYAGRLEEAGMTVELIDDFPATPTVVGRLRGDAPGPTVVLNGHLDTIPIAHDPARVADGVVYGRGAADMKGALACAAEASRIVGTAGSFAGELVVVAIGLHEAPDGRAEDLRHLLHERGFRADAAVVGELCGHDVVVAHMGQATAEITVSRPGLVEHELRTPAGTSHPLLAAGRVLEAISARNEELARVEHPWVGVETYFVGELHGGDFFNRFPTSCRLAGTRRWSPATSFEAVEAEYRALLASVAAATGCTIDLELRLVRDSYRIDPGDPLVAALQASYRDVTGLALEPVGIKVVADGAIFQAAGIPAVYHGPVGSGAHGDLELVTVAELARAAKVYVALLARLLVERVR